jgi:hypothetical protein
VEGLGEQALGGVEAGQQPLSARAAGVGRAIIVLVLLFLLLEQLVRRGVLRDLAASAAQALVACGRRKRGQASVAAALVEEPRRGHTHVRKERVRRPRGADWVLGAERQDQRPQPCLVVGLVEAGGCCGQRGLGAREGA